MGMGAFLAPSAKIGDREVAQAVSLWLGRKLTIRAVTWSYASTTLSNKPVSPAAVQKTRTVDGSCLGLVAVDRRHRSLSNAVRGRTYCTGHVPRLTFDLK